MRSPIKWAGGKSRLRKVIIDMMPPHDTYIEVFGGAGWVLFGKPPSRNVEVFNDIDRDLINFFRVVKEKPEELIASFEWDLVSRDVFEHLVKINPENLTDVERAHRFYYLIMSAWGGEWKLPRFQTSITDGGHGNRLIGALSSLRERIMPVHARLKTVIIERLDWRTCLEKYDHPEKHDRIVMYLDPPYPRNNVNYVHNIRSVKDHLEIINALTQVRSHCILTTYDTPKTRELLAHTSLVVTAVDFAAGMPKNGKGTSSGKRHQNRELIVSNFMPRTPPAAVTLYGADHE